MNLKSIVKHLQYSFFTKEKKLEKPTVIQFPVIDICNSRCQMCRIWENKKSSDITVERLKVGLKNKLFSNVEGIGFNGGEPTLRDDLLQLVEVAIENLPSLRNISLITNAYNYNKVIEQITKVGELVKKRNKHFDVMVSLDGFESVHDKVRGRSGNFENAKKVLAFLSNFKSVDNVRIGCTVIRENVFYLADLFEFCVSNKLYIKFRQGVPHQRLYTENLLDPYALTFEEKYEFVEFLEGLIKHYEPSALQRIFYRSLIDQILYNKPRSAGCDWKHKGATITAKGELAYCAVKSKAIMNDIADGDPLKEYFGHRDHLRNIVKRECANCHHDYVGLPSRSVYRKLLLERFDERFRVKATLRMLPGFSVLKKLRHKLAYSHLLKNYRALADIQPEKSCEKQILICGWYGTETLGDKGIISGIMYSLRQQLGENIHFTVVALYPYVSEMTRRQMIEFQHTRIVSIEEGIGLARQMDYVIFGGGPLMAIDPLAPMQIIFERAKEGHAKTIVAGCGVGPLGDKWHNESIAQILRLSDIRIYRDARSREYALQLGVQAQEDVVAEDPAFTWLASIADKLPTQRLKAETQVLLLGLRDFPYQEYARHIPEKEALSIRENYEHVVVDALKKLIEQRPNLIIRPLPMCTNHFGADDRWFYRRLFRQHTVIHDKLDYSLLGPELAPVEYCKAFRNADALLAMRFHSLVFGLGLGVNSVAIDYTLGKGKVRSLAERFGAPLLDMMDLKVDDVVEKISTALDSESSLPIAMEQLSFAAELKRKVSVE